MHPYQCAQASKETDELANELQKERGMFANEQRWQIQYGLILSAKSMWGFAERVRENAVILFAHLSPSPGESLKRVTLLFSTVAFFVSLEPSSLFWVPPTYRMAFSEVDLLFLWLFGRWPAFSLGGTIFQGSRFEARLASPDQSA